MRPDRHDANEAKCPVLPRIACSRYQRGSSPQPDRTEAGSDGSRAAISAMAATAPGTVTGTVANGIPT